ncbi:MAG TPA: TolC family protein [Pyrinomonadaceae bacterium]|nr:TolC family protein [Pyrinomonadaceae bacterium]
MNGGIRQAALSTLVLVLLSSSGVAQRKPKKSSPAPAKPAAEQPETELSKLRDEYVKTTQEYKASLEKLLALYQDSVKKAEDKRDQAQKLFADGLMSKREVEQTEIAVTSAGLKVTEVQQQIKTADTQIAQALIEVEGDKEIAKLGPIRRGSLIRTTSFIRYNGAGSWVLSQSGKIEAFFQQTFHRPLPIAVFGQGAIHNQWRLDHRNAMDISLNPDGAEGQALINFLQSNGIPFSAFRTAIPGVATGPHIHIGMPSHRY